MSNEMTNVKSEKQATVAREEPPRAFTRPRVDVFEHEAEYLVVADMPGVSPDALDVRFESGELRIEGRRRAGPQGNALHEESRRLDFARVFAMPEGIEADKIDASLDRGVLTLKLPKSAAKRPRRIAVRAG